MKDLKWSQQFVIHCPDHNCKGMLLTSPYVHPYKCSKCGKYWIEICKWEEVSKNEIK